LSIFHRIFGNPQKERAPLQPLYRALVDRARSPIWYEEGGVPDTLDGRFDMVAALLSLTLIRLEREGDAAKAETVLLTEIFIDDMEGTIRQLGIGDMMVGKQVGRMVSALGGRLSAFRGDITGAVRRNVFHDAPPTPEAEALVCTRLSAFRDAMAAIPAEQIIKGEVPQA
jgi:cytochrome b pre-mRNA-processing protein 3